MIKLNDFAKLKGISPICTSNIDDIILAASQFGISELKVSKEEMDTCVLFYLSSCGDKDSKKPEILRNGKIDKLLGVNLILSREDAFPTNNRSK